MTDKYDKTFTRREINDILLDLSKDYSNLYKNGMMTFQEWSILENVFIKIQIRLDEKGDVE